MTNEVTARLMSALDAATEKEFPPLCERDGVRRVLEKSVTDNCTTYQVREDYRDKRVRDVRCVDGKVLCTYDIEEYSERYQCVTLKELDQGVRWHIGFARPMDSQKSGWLNEEHEAEALIAHLRLEDYVHMGK